MHDEEPRGQVGGVYDDVIISILSLLGRKATPDFGHFSARFEFIKRSMRWEPNGTIQRHQGLVALIEIECLANVEWALLPV